MFRGATKVTLDDKGRMVMPTRYREQIAELAKAIWWSPSDRDQCLLIYPLPEWEQTERKLMSLPSLDPQARRLQRLMVGYATDLELDGHAPDLAAARVARIREARAARHVDWSGQSVRALGRGPLARPVVR